MCDTVERMSPDLPVMQGTHHCYSTQPPEMPRDLTVRRKMRPVPPPLDLSKRTLDNHHHSQHQSALGQHQPALGQHQPALGQHQPTLGQHQPALGQHQPALHQSHHDLHCSPRSPFLQKNLPLRKRAHSWSSQPGAGGLLASYPSSNTITTIHDEECDNDSTSTYPTSIPGGLPTPRTPAHPHSAIPILTSKFNFCEGSGPLNLSTGGGSGGIPSSLLSPAPSHPSTSSLSSSREELEGDISSTYVNNTSDIPSGGQHHYTITTTGHYHHHYYTSSSHHHTHHYSNTSSQPSVQRGGSSSPMQLSLSEHSVVLHDSGVKQEQLCSSNGAGGLLYTQHMEQDASAEELEETEEVGELYSSVPTTPHTTTSRLYSIKDEYTPRAPHDTGPVPAQCWPNTVWSVFIPGVRIHFVFAKNQVTYVQLSEELQLLESKHQQRYAPYGLQLIRCMSPDDLAALPGVTASPSDPTIAHLYLKPVTTQQEDIMALVPTSHPFWCRDKGWCSVEPEQTRRVYGVSCAQLSEGDLCLPPDLYPNNAPLESKVPQDHRVLPPQLETLSSLPSTSSHRLLEVSQHVISSHSDVISPHADVHSSHADVHLSHADVHPSHPHYNIDVHSSSPSHRHTDVISSPLDVHSSHPPHSHSDVLSSHSSHTDVHSSPDQHYFSFPGLHRPPPGPPTSTDYIADDLRRFDFNDTEPPMPLENRNPPASLRHSLPPPSRHGDYPPHSAPQFTPLTPVQRSVFLSPPASPSKKCGGLSRHPPPTTVIGVGDAPPPSSSANQRPRRPMNGFMLFAKHHRLKLIQQYPGKDNRAISVLLGATWKALPDRERERINSEARLQAEAMKLADPDCWKRKRRSQSTS